MLFLKLILHEYIRPLKGDSYSYIKDVFYSNWGLEEAC